MFIESQDGLINSDSISVIEKPCIITGDHSEAREFAIIIRLLDGSTRTQKFGDDREKAEKAFKHYVNILTTNTG